MRSMFSLEEVGKMLEMQTDTVKRLIEEGRLDYTFHEGDKYISLYDLEKYMGSEQTQKITREFLDNHS